MSGGRFVPMQNDRIPDSLPVSQDTFDSNVQCNKCNFCKKYDDQVLSAIIRLFEDVTNQKFIDTNQC